MTTRTQQRDARRRVLPFLVSFLAALVAVLATLLSSASASAATQGTAETRVRASASVVEVPVGPPERIAAGQRLGNEPARAVVVLATGVAANAGSKLLPKVDDVFRFPGAGRSGAGVKNFVGPPNTIARGASPGRVFVTDDQGRVIFDITRDRVKPVVPGQGFISGDGRKLAPTPEQLAWIDELWGG